jgi:CYTH domain-containing protein
VEQSPPLAIRDPRRKRAAAMAIAIEPKFLVRSEEWRKYAIARDVFWQAYLASGERSSMRERDANATDATVTITSK